MLFAIICRGFCRWLVALFSGSRFPPLPLFSVVRLIVASLVVLALGSYVRAADRDEKRSFDVPAVAAEKSLKLFSEQSGRGVVFVTDKVNDVHTKAVKGQFTPREALDLMLTSTGLAVKQDEKTGALAILQEADSRVSPTLPGSNFNFDSNTKKKLIP
jgi:hypothetical protein